MTEDEYIHTIKRLRKLALEAIDEIEGWGAYAGDYFQEKWDLGGTVARLRNSADNA